MAADFYNLDRRARFCATAYDSSLCNSPFRRLVSPCKDANLGKQSVDKSAATSPAARLRDDCGSGTRQGIANLQFAIFLALLLLPATLFAQISIPEGSDTDPIVIRAQAANQWQQDKHEVWLLRGDCRLMQGDDVAVCQEAVFWIEHAPAGSHERSKVIAYLEGNVGVHLIRNHQPVEIRDQKWFGRFSTVREVQVSAGIVAGKPNVLPGIYQRGMEQRKPEVSDALQQNGVNPAQYIAANELPPPGQPSPSMGPLPPGTPPVSPGTRRFRISSRSEVPMQGQWQQDPQTHQAVAVASQGVTMVVEGLPVRKGSIPGVANGLLTIDLSTDRLVVWTVSENQPDIKDAVVQDEDKPLEVYMEGHVVFREGERIDLCRPHVLRRAEPRGHGAGRRDAHAGAGLRGQASRACRRNCRSLPRTTSAPRTHGSPPAAWAFPASACRRARPSSTTKSRFSIR